MFVFVFTLLLLLNFVQTALAIPYSLQERCSEDIKESNRFSFSESGRNASKITFEEGRDDIAIFDGVVTGHFLKILDQLPSSIKTIALRLPRGGHAIDSILIAQKIREMGLNTYVGLSTCHSACTIIFQGGVERIVDSMALLTYHGPSNIEEQNSCSQEIVEYGSQKLIEWGFPKSELHVLNSNSSVHYFNSDRLIKTGIATKIQSLSIGYDEAIKKAWKSRDEYCEKYPEDDEC